MEIRWFPALSARIGAFVVFVALLGGVACTVAAPAFAAPTTTLPPKGRSVVHITIRGDHQITLDGTAVTCQPGGGTTNVAIDAHDYPALGKGGYLVVLVPEASQFAAAVRARVGKTGYTSKGSQDQASWKVSGRKVTFSKVDASGGRRGIRVSGAVVCP